MRKVDKGTKGIKKITKHKKKLLAVEFQHSFTPVCTHLRSIFSFILALFCISRIRFELQAIPYN